jgi:hypothetical protein
MGGPIFLTALCLLAFLLDILLAQHNIMMNPRYEESFFNISSHIDKSW